MKILHHPLAVIVVIILILIAFLFILNLAGKRFIEKEIRNLEISAFTFSAPPKLYVNLLKREISVKQAILEREGTDSIHIQNIRFKGIHVFPLLFKGHLVVNKVSVDKPGVFLSKNSGRKPDYKAKKKISIKKLEVKNGQLKMNEPESSGNGTVFYTELNADMWNVDLNSKAQKYLFENNSFGRIRLSAKNSSLTLPNKRYRAHCDTLYFDSQNQSFTANDIRLKSYYSKYKIAQEKGVETDWYDLSLDSFALQGFHLDKFLNDNLLVATKAELNKLNLHTFRDKRLPFPDKRDTRLPMEQINNLPFNLHTDTILVTNAYVDYTEHREDSDKAGIIKFFDVNATILNLSNTESLTQGKTVMKVSARPMNESMFNAEFVFPNKRYPEKYRVSGMLEPLKMDAFNPMLMPVASVQIKSGDTKTLAFNFSYDDNAASGEVTFEYENLKVVLLNKKNNPKTIKSFLANTFKIKKNHLQQDKSFKKGTISFERDKKKSVFNYWWKSLLSGLKDVLDI